MWQFGLSEFETEAGGAWRLGGTVDYSAKAAFGCRVATTQTVVDMIPDREQAIAATEGLLGRTRSSDCIDATTGEIQPLVIVTDNGPAMRSIAVARWFNARPHLRHVRTRHKARETNGVIERWFESLKCKRPYPHGIDDGLGLGDHVAVFLDELNRIRPHEGIGWQRPLERYLQDPESSNPTDPETEPEP